jgi:transcriptional regulator with XRE-family HTH domain
MDKKQKEELVLALLEKGETYRDIARKAGVSPNTIKAIANKSGLDETASISSRAFELFSEGKTPLQVAIALNLEAEKAIQYHQQYYMLLGCTEFTKVYLQIKDNPWPYVNLTNLVHNSRMGDGKVIELLKIANGHLPRVRLEYDRARYEVELCKAEINSSKAGLNNIARTYQQFVDRNIVLKNREDELLLSISELENKKAELQSTITSLQQQLAGLQENNAYNSNLNLEIEHEDIIFTNDIFIPMPNMSANYHQNENEMHAQTESSSKKLILDTRDLFRYQQE